jgi:TetR/AcrR family transcriptional repressor of lmrAB and yxaGH operons
MNASSGSASRTRMLEATVALMRGSGLTGAGINDIVRESRSPKGSVYHFFPKGKIQIATEALESYSPRVLEFIDRALAGKRLPGDKVKALFDAFARRVAEGDYRRSCAVGTVCLDLDESLEELRIVLDSILAEWVALIARHFDLGDARRTRSFAGLILSAIEGAYVRSRAERSGRAFREAGVWLAELATLHAKVGLRAARG